MFNKLFSFFLIGSVFCFASGAVVFAQDQQTSQQKKTEEVKAKIKKLGLGERVKVNVKLFSGTSYQGYVSQAGEDDFVVVDKTGASNTLRYSDVKSVGGKNLSTGAKIAIGIGIGAGAVLAVLGILFASLDD